MDEIAVVDLGEWTDYEVSDAIDLADVEGAK